MQVITEDMGIHEEWYKKSKNISIDEIESFAKSLLNDYRHDYGTIVHAFTAAAIGIIRAMDSSSPQGGITGFQAGCIMWEFIRRWMRKEDIAMRLIMYDEMLYPQYEHRFSKKIPGNIWGWLQEEAKKKLSEAEGNDWHPRVIAHLESIVNGIIPFGYSIEEK